QHFTMIPFYQIQVPAHTLIISTHSPSTPLFEDLPHTVYASQTASFFKQQTQPLKWYNLGSSLVDYAQSLESLRLLAVTRGNAQALCTLLAKDMYPVSADQSGMRWVPSAQMYLQEVEKKEVQDVTGTDHLFRLYTYQDVMAQIGSDFFDKKSLKHQWTADAERAYIVTPVSSLIVLETVEDYERFDITKNKNSVGNATLNNNGAVPEPHEWALIILVVLSLVFYLKMVGKG
ncbi:MAG: hypothetical protein AAFR59_19345, partial [Bacteroidota bacterium]